MNLYTKILCWIVIAFLIWKIQFITFQNNTYTGDYPFKSIADFSNFCAVRWIASRIIYLYCSSTDVAQRAKQAYSIVLKLITSCSQFWRISYFFNRYCHYLQDRQWLETNSQEQRIYCTDWCTVLSTDKNLCFLYLMFWKY